jgi:type II secretory pathway pseudopilin PulG
MNEAESQAAVVGSPPGSRIFTGHPMRTRLLPVPRRTAFTIVELLVTVGIIALLTGIIVAGVRSALGTARKTKELNLMRGVHAAWSQYANTYEEQLLPGFVDEPTQAAWRVNYRNMSGAQLPTSVSQTYPWRIARFLDDPYGTLLAYRAEEGSVERQNDLPESWMGEPAIPSWMSNATSVGGSGLALQPAFGYNAFYVGGWWENGQMAFENAAWTPQGGTAARNGGLTATRLSHIARPGELGIFFSSTLRSPGTYRDSTSGEDALPGSAWVVPPMLAQQVVWGPFMGTMQGLDAGAAGGGAGASMVPFLAAAPQGGTDTGVLQVNVNQSVPLRRYNGKTAVLRADGSVGSSSVGELLDMRAWIDAADIADFAHQN